MRVLNIPALSAGLSVPFGDTVAKGGVSQSKDAYASTTGMVFPPISVDSMARNARRFAQMSDGDRLTDDGLRVWSQFSPQT